VGTTFQIRLRTRDGHHPCLFTVHTVDDRLPSTMAHLQGSGSPITQVSQTPVAPMHLQPQLLTRLQLDLRGKRFTVDRETIMNLPESILLCLFPNGLVLSRQSAMLSDGGENDEFEELYGVDVRYLALHIRFADLSLLVRPRVLLFRPRVLQTVR
jgi:hypothetical protein